MNITGILAGAASLLTGTALAVATVTGIVEAQGSAGEKQVHSNVVNYGSR